MAVTNQTPTPPDARSSPYVDVRIPTISGTNVHYINAGFWEAIAQHWSVESINLTLVTDATVANRQIRLQVQNNPEGEASLVNYFGSPDVAASTTHNFGVHGMGYVSGSATIKLSSSIGLTRRDGLVIRGRDRLVMYIDTGKAGDTLDGWVRLRYMNKELGLPTPYDGL